MSPPAHSRIPSNAAGLPNQMPFYPPPGLPHPPVRLPYLYGQYHSGMNLPLYFPPYPLGQHGNVGAWGYGPPATNAVPGALPHTGSLQPTLPTSIAPVLAPVPSEGAGQLAANPAMPQPRRIYPNRLVGDGGKLHSTE